MKKEIEFKNRMLDVMFDINKDYKSFEEFLKCKKKLEESFIVYFGNEPYELGIDINSFDKMFFIKKNEEKIYLKNPKDSTKEIENFFYKNENKTSDKKGSIYLITDGKYTKIGATSYNVKKRLNELQTGNAKELNIIYEYKVKNKLSTEKFLHEKFKEKQVLGEWFNLKYEDIQYIIKNKFSINNGNISFDKKLEKNIQRDIEILDKIHDKYLIKVFKRYKNEIFYNSKVKEEKLNPKQRFYLKIIKENSNNKNFIHDFFSYN